MYYKLFIVDGLYFRPCCIRLLLWCRLFQNLDLCNLLFGKSAKTIKKFYCFCWIWMSWKFVDISIPWWKEFLSFIFKLRKFEKPFENLEYLLSSYQLFNLFLLLGIERKKFFFCVIKKWKQNYEKLYWNIIIRKLDSFDISLIYTINIYKTHILFQILYWIWISDTFTLLPCLNLYFLEYPSYNISIIMLKLVNLERQFLSIA